MHLMDHPRESGGLPRGPWQATSHPTLLAAMHELGVGCNTHVVVYDCSDFGIFSAPRLWWTLRAFGHDNVSVLNGGLQQWKANDLPLETGSPLAAPTPSEVGPMLHC